MIEIGMALILLFGWIFFVMTRKEEENFDEDSYLIDHYLPSEPSE